MRQTTTQQTLSSYVLTVSDTLLAGQTISALDGCTLTINGAAPTLPHTLAVGEVLAVTHGRDRTHPSGLTLLAQVAADTPAGTLPDPDPAQWTWVDTFSRAFLGTDYATDLSSGQQAVIESGAFTLGQAVVRDSSSGAASAHAWARLSAARWNSRNAQIQYDSTFTLVFGPGSSPPALGVRLIGASKNLSWNGSQLLWGAGVLASANAATADVLTRTRLSIDEATGRIQVQRGGSGLVDVAVPADYAAQMGPGGLVELFHETHTDQSGADYTRYKAAFDNLALRSGDGTASQATGSSGTAVRLGSQWRLANGAPDDAQGANGDIWLDTSSSSLYQRVNGSYVASGNIRGLKGDPGAAGPAGKDGSNGSTRLSSTRGFAGLMPSVGASGNTVTQYENGVYGKALVASFATTRAIPVEGFRMIADAGLVASEIQYAELADLQGNVIDLGQFSAAGDPLNPDQPVIFGTWKSGRMLPPGGYTLTIAWQSGATTPITGKVGQHLGGGMTSFVGRKTGGSDLPIGLSFTFTSGLSGAVGQLDVGAMRVVPAPSDPGADPASWYDGAFEVVAAAGGVPYLRTRHEGKDYRLDFQLVPPAGGGEVS